MSQRYDQRIFRAFGLNAEGEVYLNACKDGLLRHDLLSEIIHLLRIRYFLSERVYFHHTKTASGAMISRAVEEALDQAFTLQDLEQHSDETLIYALSTTYPRNKIIEMLLSALASHRIYKRAYLLTRQIGEAKRLQLVNDYHLSSQSRREAERALCKSLRLKEGQLILYCPAFGMQLKEASVKVRTQHGGLRTLSDLKLPELETLKERHQDLWKMYVFVHPEVMTQSQRIAEACERYFGVENHLPALRSGQMFLSFD